MSFDYIHRDKWNAERKITIDAPQTFTMPAHTVLFYNDPSK